MRWFQKRLAVLAALLLITILAAPAASQNNRIILSNNIGTRSAVWDITDEPTLVMNGFDITPTPLSLPIVVENINIDMFQGVANDLFEVVVYEDPNGGSPVDARLVARTQVAIPVSFDGVFVAQFDEPVVVTSPVFWIGFYMPEGARFRADRQGTSVLTYWGWTPDNRFDLRNLSSAEIFGPSDGTSPVNLNIGGVARIRAEAFSGQQLEPIREDFGFAVPEENLDVLLNYSGCPTLFKDEADVVITLNNAISGDCREVESWNAPRTPSGFTRRTNVRNIVYDLTFYNEEGQVLTGLLPSPITHCVTPAADEQEEAVIGIAYGSPRNWEFLTSERFGNLVCAEVPRGGSLSYFTPDG